MWAQSELSVSFLCCGKESVVFPPGLAWVLVHLCIVLSEKTPPVSLPQSPSFTSTLNL